MCACLGRWIAPRGVDGCFSPRTLILALAIIIIVYLVWIVQAVQVVLVKMQDKLDVLKIETEGHLHVEGIQYAYMQHAMLIQQSRAKQNEVLGPQSICSLLIVIPTGYRITLGENGYKYVEDTVASLRNLQAVKNGLLEKVCVLVLNNSPNTHANRFEEVKKFRKPMCGDCQEGEDEGAVPLGPDNTCQHWCSAKKRCGTSGAYQGLGSVHCEFTPDSEYSTRYMTSNITTCSPGGCRSGNHKVEQGVNLNDDGRCTAWCFEDTCGNSPTHQQHGTNCNGLAQLDIRFIGQTNFEDPYWHEYIKVADGVVGSAPNTRKQGMHLSHGLLEASRWEAKYVLLMEDDMPVCSPSALQKLDEAITLTEDVCRKANIDWSLLRVGFGGNGVLLHWDDAVLLGKYILDHVGRRPIDWIIPEWGASFTYSSQMLNAIRHRHIFTFRENLFKHIGRSSSFSKRAWNEGEQATLPMCYAPNFFLRPEESFKAHCTGNISPCFCPETNSLCEPS